MPDIWLPGKLPGLNEIIAANRTHRQKGARLKRSTTRALAWVLRGFKVPAGATRWHFHWIETSKRRDPDNIASGVKFIFDAMITAGIIENDGWQQVTEIHHTFEVGSEAGVLVTVER
jgi:Holliday junction resolvase RusA-like endonuclease